MPTDGRATSIGKALDVCEALSRATRGLTVTELSRSLRLPPSTVHRLLRLLKQRGFVRQDDDTARYGLTLKMLDLSFRLLGRSELRLHAYPVLREHALRSGRRSFLASPSLGEVTYVWSTGPDEVAMHTAYGREMPGHCSLYFDPSQRSRQLSCLRLELAGDGQAPARPLRLGGPLPSKAGVRMLCACAPVHDYAGREVARVGLFRHGDDDRGLAADDSREAWELARLISLRLGHLVRHTLAVTA